MLRLVQHEVKGILKAAKGHGLGQPAVHHPAAQGQQAPYCAPAQHRAAHQFVPRLVVHRESVSRPGVFRAVQAPGQQTAGVRVPVLHRLLEQLQALLSPPGSHVVVDVLQGCLHPVAEKSAHWAVLLPPGQLNSVRPAVSSRFFLASGLF